MQPDNPPAGARRAIRRAVHLGCDLVSGHHEEPLRYVATDLSADGVFLRTPDPVRAGSEVVVCFRPDGWERELMLFAEVARVTSSRGRRVEPGIGMGLEFLDLTAAERARLEAWLRSRREPVPRRRRPLPRVAEPARGSCPPAALRPSPACWR